MLKPPSISLLKVDITPSASPLRSKPWSINIQISWSPIALSKRAATTEESTPPDNAQRTF